MDPEAVRDQAFLDQYRAAAEEALSHRIQAYRQLCDEFNDDNVFNTVVAEFYRDIDPDNDLCTEHSNQLTLMAEVLTCAISRLAKEGCR